MYCRMFIKKQRACVCARPFFVILWPAQKARPKRYPTRGPYSQRAAFCGRNRLPRRQTYLRRVPPEMTSKCRAFTEYYNKRTENNSRGRGGFSRTKAVGKRDFSGDADDETHRKRKMPEFPRCDDDFQKKNPKSYSHVFRCEIQKNRSFYSFCLNKLTSLLRFYSIVIYGRRYS